MQEPTAAKWAVGATIDPHRTILKLVRDGAMAAIELAAPDDGLQYSPHRFALLVVILHVLDQPSLKPRQAARTFLSNVLSDAACC